MTDRCVVSWLSAGHWKLDGEETEALFSSMVARTVRA